MNEKVTEAFSRLELAVSRQRGPFVLFALLVREELPDRWDLIVSAPWAKEDKDATVDYLVEQIKAQLGDDALVMLSQIVVADPDAAEVVAFNRAFHVQHGEIEIRDSDLFGVPIKRAFVITSARPPAPAAATA